MYTSIEITETMPKAVVANKRLKTMENSKAVFQKVVAFVIRGCNCSDWHIEVPSTMFLKFVKFQPRFLYLIKYILTKKEDEVQLAFFVITEPP